MSRGPVIHRHRQVSGQLIKVVCSHGCVMRHNGSKLRNSPRWTFLFASFCSPIQLTLFRVELQYPGAVARLFEGLAGFVARPAALPHFPENLQPAMAPAAQRTSMTL